MVKVNMEIFKIFELKLILVDINYKEILIQLEEKMNYFEKANNLYNCKDYKNAISFYKKSIELKENQASSFYNSAVCFIKLKEYENAIPLLKSAIKHKNESKYFFNLAYCCAMTRNNKKALIYFNMAWCLDNSDSDCEKAINIIINSLRTESE